MLSFSEALSNETAGTGVTVTCLCPGPTGTGFQERAQMQESRLLTLAVASAADVARAGFDGMMAGQDRRPGTRQQDRRSGAPGHAARDRPAADPVHKGEALVPRFKLLIEYAGTRYSGWQIQQNARTVQGEIERAIRAAFRPREFELYGSGEPMRASTRSRRWRTSSSTSRSHPSRSGGS